MRLLLDTHALLWWLTDDKRLRQPARRAIEDKDNNEVLISAASAWEIATKHRLGKLPSADAVAPDIPGAIIDQGFGELAITVDEASRAGSPSRPLRQNTHRAGIVPQLGAHLD